MEQYFDLHQVASLQNVNIASMCLKQHQNVWYQGLCEKKKDSVITWSLFIGELKTHYGDIKNTTLFSELINLQQKGPVIEHIQQLKILILKVKNISKGNHPT